MIAECRQCVGLTGPDLPDTSGLEAAPAELGGRIARSYAMVCERELHARIFVKAAGMPAAAASDEALFDDALFRSAAFPRLASIGRSASALSLYF